MDGGWRATGGTHHFINNRWVAASARESLDVIDGRAGRRPFDLSFGGVKSSCYGREKVFEALLGSTWVKTITIRHG
jgi:acyl-CoA reductase-like NAD-dependent aldehyde dehydrogenase